MQIKISGRHMEVTDAIKDFIEKKISRLNKYHNRISEIEVVLDGEGLKHKTEIIVAADHHQPFVVTESGEDMYACVDLAMDKIERQLIKHKEKSRNHKGHAGAGQATMEILESRDEEQAS